MGCRRISVVRQNRMVGCHVRGGNLEQRVRGQIVIATRAGHDDPPAAPLAEPSPCLPRTACQLPGKAAAQTRVCNLREHSTPGERGWAAEERAESGPRVGFDEINQAPDERGGWWADHAVCR